MEVEETTSATSSMIVEAPQSTTEQGEGEEESVESKEEEENNKEKKNNNETTTSSMNNDNNNNDNITTNNITITAPELLYANVSEKKIYWDRSHYDSPHTQLIALSKSSTVYIGNLAFTTTSDHILSLFSTVGNVRKIHIGLDRYKKSPCGFAFVEYCSRSSALQAVMFLSGCKLDGRVVRVELDAGFKPGRQYGRGVSGGQVRDDRRGQHDPARSIAAFQKSNISGQKRGRVDDDDEVMMNISDQKRGRVDDDDIQQPATKNPRFAQEDDDDEL